MGQRSIALYLSMKRLPVKEIHQKFRETLSLNTVGYSEITWYLYEAEFASQNQEAAAEAKWLSTNAFDVAIMKALSDNPFPLALKSLKLTCLSRSATRQRFTKLLDFTVRYFRRIPHRLSGDQEAIRANLFRELLRALQADKAHGWDKIVTLDESQFCFLMDHKRI
jgi:hypothetical protein